MEPVPAGEHRTNGAETMSSTSPNGAEPACPEDTPLLNIGRDVHGRFRPGNQGGPGNPFARTVAWLRKALLESVTEQDVKEPVQILKQQARQGDKGAIKLLWQ